MSILEKEIKACNELQKKLERKRLELEKDIGLDSKEIPIVALNYIQNFIIITTEVMDLYRSISKDIKAPQLERKLREFTSRIIEVQKMTLLNSLSAFEYVAKKYHAANPHVLGNVARGWIHLWDIMDKSKEKKIISEKQFELWEGVNNLRRFIVHNNSDSDITKEYVYPNITLSFKENETAARGIEVFSRLLDWIIDAIVEWILAFESKK